MSRPLPKSEDVSLHVAAGTANIVALCHSHTSQCSLCYIHVHVTHLQLKSRFTSFFAEPRFFSCEVTGSKVYMCVQYSVTKGWGGGGL